MQKSVISSVILSAIQHKSKIGVRESKGNPRIFTREREREATDSVGKGCHSGLVNAHCPGLPQWLFPEDFFPSIVGHIQTLT